MQRWFLSYNSQDLGLIQGLESALRRKDPDARIFFAPKSLRAGGYWLPALAEEIAQATVFVLLVGDRGIGAWQDVEYYEAFDKRVKSPDFPVVLVLREGQPAPGLPFLRQLHWIVTPDPASEQAAARLVDAAAGGGDRPGELWRYTSPYRGLAAMTEADSDFFFGRQRETTEVLAALAGTADKLPVLLGNSGVGKSSLAQAGVLAALKRQAWPEGAGAGTAWPSAFHDSRHWCFLTLKPGAEPLKALVVPFLDTWQYGATDPERFQRQADWIKLLGEGDGRLCDLLDATEARYRELNQPKPPAFFIYIDQGEELYVRSEERQRRRFSKLVAEALADPRIHALMSLRADFLGALQNDEPLYTVHHKIDVPPLREAELREVVSRPAALLSARFESEALADDIARRAAEESAKDAGALPLLSYLLDDMWTQMVARGDGTLRLPAQALDLGGVLAERANAFLARHPTSEETLRRVLTLKLATVRENGEPTRRIARRSEFTDEQWRLVCELADHPHRLLITAMPEDGEPYAEVAHEAIFRRWDKLRGWMRDEREFLVWKSKLEADRRSWEETAGPSRDDALLMGLPLAQAQTWLAKRAEDLSKADREFIDLSVRHETQERQQRESLRRRVFATAIAALVIVTGLALFSFFQWREAEGQRLEAEAQRREAEGQRLEAVKQQQAAQEEHDRAEQAVATFSIRLVSGGSSVDRAITDLDKAIELNPTDATNYFVRAMYYYALKNDNDRANADLGQVVRLNPKFTAAYLIRGSIYEKMQDYDHAIAAYSEAMKLDPTNPIPVNFRGFAYSNKQDYDRAIADYDQAIRLDPNFAHAHANRGSLFSAKNDHERAIAEYSEAIKLDPANTNTYSWYRNRGIAYSYKNDPERAIADYDQAIRLKSDDAVAYHRRGLAYHGKADYDRAIADYSEAIGLDPNAREYHDRGVAYHTKQDYDRAIADYTEAIRLDPKYAPAYGYRADAYKTKTDYDRAIADYSKALELDPTNASADGWYRNRGHAYYIKMDYDRAIADCEEAIRLKPADAEAFTVRASAYYGKRDYDRAIADYDEAIRLEPNRADAFNGRGSAYFKKKDHGRAIADYDEAIRLDPKHATVFNNRGDAYADKKDFRRAIADYAEAIRLDPKDAEAFYQRGLAKQKIGDRAGGSADIAAAKRIDPNIGR